MARRLIVDVGNTSTAMRCGARVWHLDGGFAAAREIVLSLLGGGGFSPALSSPDTIFYSSVVPSVDANWQRLASEHHLLFRQVAFDCGGLRLRYDYPEPETIGADRLCDAEAAFARYGAPVIVMDFGTALTAAVVTAPGVWQGGVIAPGFPLMRDYLFERTAKLPRMELGTGEAPRIGKTTAEAMRFGAIVGYRGMVREIVAELRKNFAADFRLVATGGFASWVLKGLDLPFVIDPDLTLNGVELICSRIS